ncbi:MAG: tungstate ABC transporter substrate-binding protein WtpA, partial [Dehalococcoidales bacterium]|nr:tungstate ABC transporter substrate-binding protein WtpA [Dehalococcoidales bacterium]
MTRHYAQRFSSGKIGILIAFCVVIGTAGCFVMNACGTLPLDSPEKTKLVVFEAGSLMVPFAQMEKEFEAANQDIDVQLEAHGSIQVIRHLVELGEDIDVVAVADYSLIPMLMYPSMMGDGNPYADWYIEPAANQLVLAYTEQSRYANEVNSNTWYDIIAREDVKLGLSDPRMDAVGYRTLMVLKLAESYYHDNQILQKAVTNSFTYPVSEVEIDESTVIKVPELLEPADNHVVLRGASMQLLALLHSNDVDYAFEYKSVALQQGLKYLELPPEINLGDEAFAETYRTVRVKLDFRRFTSVDPEFEGIPIGYGMTIAANSAQPEAAVRFMQFVLGPDGQRIFLENSHPPLVPAG